MENVVIMKCNITYVGKKRTGKPQYYCIKHKEYASDKEGNKLDECLCNYKDLFDNPIDIKETNIKSVKILYSNILEDTIPTVLINNEEFKGVLKFDNSILTYKDLTGTMLSKLNNVPLEIVKCNHCNQPHSDNGKFAYTPHSTHLCLYCGHLFRVRERNIGNEFTMIHNVPDIKLDNKSINIENNCLVEYDIFKGTLLVNKENVNKISIAGKEISVVDFLNKLLKDEF